MKFRLRKRQRHRATAREERRTAFHRSGATHRTATVHLRGSFQDVPAAPWHRRGALTDAAAETFYTLPRETQKQILRACCDAREGIGYSLGRTHINSCDFSSESCTCVQHGDTQLKSFSIAHDLKCRIPFIKEVLAAAGNEFTIFACPWSPPAWMKDNHDMLHGGELMPQFYDSWANYYVKLIKACEKEGIPIWGLTVQNEPMAVPPRESCVFTASEKRDSVKSHLGPIMAKSGLEDKKILIWDHNHRSMMYQRAEVVLDDPEAARYVRRGGFSLVHGRPFRECDQLFHLRRFAHHRVSEQGRPDRGHRHERVRQGPTVFPVAGGRGGVHQQSGSFHHDARDLNRPEPCAPSPLPAVLA
jgi:O-glycosyl hydrolase